MKRRSPARLELGGASKVLRKVSEMDVITIDRALLDTVTLDSTWRELLPLFSWMKDRDAAITKAMEMAAIFYLERCRRAS